MSKSALLLKSICTDYNTVYTKIKVLCTTQHNTILHKQKQQCSTQSESLCASGCGPVSETFV